MQYIIPIHNAIDESSIIHNIKRKIPGIKKIIESFIFALCFYLFNLDASVFARSIINLTESFILVSCKSMLGYLL